MAEETGIVRIDAPESGQDHYLVFATNGQVYTVSKEDKLLIDDLRYAMNFELEVKLKLAQELKPITDVLQVSDEIIGIDMTNDHTDEALDYNEGFTKTSMKLSFEGVDILRNAPVTDFKSEQELLNKFYSQRKDLKSRAQCYNRAHVWVHEMRKKYYRGNKITMGKIWIFYSKYFINRINYKWWFHIAPYSTLNGAEKVMDRTFLDRPLGPNQWVQSFFDNPIQCKNVQKYSAYRNNQRSADCFLIRTSLYYWQPFQVKKAETDGIERTDLPYGALKRAYRNAVSWFARVP